jgi:S1-C subfamily serine protease
MKQWSSSRVIVLTCAVLASLAAPLFAQSGRRMREPSDIMFLAGSGASLGVTVRDGDNPDKQPGVIVEDVLPGGAAERAGIKRADVITEFDGQQVRSARQFSRLVEEAAPGRAVKTTVVRDGKRSDLTVTPSRSERPATVMIDPDRIRERMREIVPNLDFDLPGSRARLGVTVESMTPQLAAYFGARSGVLVSSVSDNSPAARAGLKVGDVIVSIDGQSVASRADLTHVLRNASDRQEVTIGIVRDKQASSVKVTVERPQPSRDTRQLRMGRTV